MCGRFALDSSLDELIAHYAVVNNRLPDWAPHWNIAPTTTIPLVIDVVEGDEIQRTLGPARWWLTPAWSETLDTPYPTFNARSESVSTKASFRHSLVHHRGVVPATGYFEWKTEGSTKTPHYIHESDDSLMSFAALYSTWRGGENPVVTVTILTHLAPENVAHIHPRAPLRLATEEISGWLDPRQPISQDRVNELTESSRARGLALDSYPVNALRGDGPELLAPAHS